jgi:tRNA(fMet)-specific endonuclease VapC
MLRFLLDSDHVTLLQHHHPPLMTRLASHAIEEVGVSIVTVEEALRGRLAALARARDGKSRIQ